MKLGNFGKQIVLVSPKAFSQNKYIGYEESAQDVRLSLRK